LLPSLCTTAQQDDKRVAVASKVDTKAWPEFDPVLQHTFVDALSIRRVALRQPEQSRRHFSRRNSIETIEPLLERAPPGADAVLNDP
jgi:hypothetical protein